MTVPHLSAIAKLAPHLTPRNREALLKQATHRSKRQIEELIAELAPRPDAPALMRKLPERRTLPRPALPLGPDRVGVVELCPDGVPPPAPAPGPPPVVQPLAPARYKVQFRYRQVHVFAVGSAHSDTWCSGSRSVATWRREPGDKWALVLRDGKGGKKELSHGGAESDLGELAVAPQALIVGA